MADSPIQHGLVKYEYQPNSFAQYRYYCECLCGFQCRLGTEQASKSQFDSHLMAHGMDAYFATLKSDAVVSESDVNKVADGGASSNEGDGSQLITGKVSPEGLTEHESTSTTKWDPFVEPKKEVVTTTTNTSPKITPLPVK